MTEPYQINPSALATHAPVLLRQLLLVAGGAATAIGFLSGHDLRGLWLWLHTEEFAAVFAAAVPFATIAYGQWRAHTDRVRLVTITEAAPDSVAVVTNTSPPPDEPGLPL